MRSICLTLILILWAAPGQGGPLKSFIAGNPLIERLPATTVAFIAASNLKQFQIMSSKKLLRHLAPPTLVNAPLSKLFRKDRQVLLGVVPGTHGTNLYFIGSASPAGIKLAARLKSPQVVYNAPFLFLVRTSDKRDRRNLSGVGLKKPGSPSAKKGFTRNWKQVEIGRDVAVYIDHQALGQLPWGKRLLKGRLGRLYRGYVTDGQGLCSQTLTRQLAVLKMFLSFYDFTYLGAARIKGNYRIHSRWRHRTGLHKRLRRGKPLGVSYLPRAPVLAVRFHMTPILMESHITGLVRMMGGSGLRYWMLRSAFGALTTQFTGSAELFMTPPNKGRRPVLGNEIHGFFRLRSSGGKTLQALLGLARIVPNPPTVKGGVTSWKVPIGGMLHLAIRGTVLMLSTDRRAVANFVAGKTRMVIPKAYRKILLSEDPIVFLINFQTFLAMPLALKQLAPNSKQLSHWKGLLRTMGTIAGRVRMNPTHLDGSVLWNAGPGFLGLLVEQLVKGLSTRCTDLKNSPGHK